MHLSTSTAFAALAGLLVTTVSADWLDTRHIVGTIPETSAWGWFHTDFGQYDLPNAGSGCGGTSVPGMVTLCIDWANERGHFRFSHQNFNRCLRKYPQGTEQCSAWFTCYIDHWREVPCNGREAPIDIGNNTVSATTAAAEATWTPDAAVAKRFEA